MLDFVFHINGDLSARCMTVLESLAPAITIYSIDEAFLHVAGSEQLMNAINGINHSGLGNVWFAGQGINESPRII
ncbi:hypothetical protein [Serratia plymuthica]|uniref:hypothetical protein n=1 Tax=Serratia plymuthica TaxID=82996 RepID=UPI002016369A|nr:hypothetical protein [Serratia plymuthica]